MPSFLRRDPCKKLNKQYYAKLEEAMQAQRNGDIRLFSELTVKASEIKEQLDALEQAKTRT